MTTPKATRPVVIIGPPPTPNGDLHLGHLAGPYLAGDIYARYLRAIGREVIYTTGTDDSQTYVLATARRRGLRPEELCVKSWHDIRRTLALMGISVDGFAPFDDGYRATVLDFVGALHAAGKFRLRTVRLPYAERTGEFLVEGLVCGECPNCLSESRGGLCETCGHPIDFDDLIEPRSTVDPDEVLTTHEAKILVLPMEAYRDQLAAYYAARERYWRPHIVQLAREVFARPLPDFPVTYPVGWGIPAPFPETKDQVINAWVEGMPASMYCTAYAAAQLGRPCGRTDELWRAERDIELVYFLGFDNAYFWGMNHLALLLAHEGRYVTPETIVCNEFYELENEKFSTSSGHAVWATDILTEVPRDLVRFYLALTSPEHQRTNFSRAALAKVTEHRLVLPWNRLATLLGKAVADFGGTDTALTVSDSARQRAGVMVQRFRACYEINGFSLPRAADVIVGQIDRLLRRAEDPPMADSHAVGDLFLEVQGLIAGAAPILIDFADAATDVAGLDHRLTADAFKVAQVRPFPLPTLSTDRG